LLQPLLFERGRAFRFLLQVLYPLLVLFLAKGLSTPLGLFLALELLLLLVLADALLLLGLCRSPVFLSRGGAAGACSSSCGDRLEFGRPVQLG